MKKTALIASLLVVLAGCGTKTHLPSEICPKAPLLTKVQQKQLKKEWQWYSAEFDDIRIDLSLDLPESQLTKALRQYLELRRRLEYCRHGD